MQKRARLFIMRNTRHSIRATDRGVTVYSVQADRFLVKLSLISLIHQIIATWIEEMLGKDCFFRNGNATERVDAEVHIAFGDLTKLRDSVHEDWNIFRGVGQRVGLKKMHSLSLRQGVKSTVDSLTDTERTGDWDWALCPPVSDRTAPPSEVIICGEEHL